MAHTPGPELCPKCGERQPNTQDWFGEAIRQKATNAALVAALKATVAALRAQARLARNLGGGIAVYEGNGAAWAQARAAIERNEA